MVLPTFDLTGQVAVVTGASRGIGRGIAAVLAEAGAVVIATARAREDLESLAAEAPGVIPAVADLADVQSIRNVFDSVVRSQGRLDVLVNNAGLGANHDSLEVTEADWDEMMAVNLKGLFFASQAAARLMAGRGYGRIVNLSSQAGLVGIRRHAVYSASKGGVDGLTRVLALDWAPLGITVNSVAPTYIRTPGTAERLDDPSIAADILARIPVGRFGSIADVAAAVLYLASPAAGLVTGTVLSVDGGWTAQ